MQKRVGIVLLNYNNFEDTIECLDSLRNIKYDNFFTVIVDNASTNESVDYLKKYESEDVFLINSGKNGGFSYGNNIGIKYALKRNADYILLLNNDTIVDKFFLNQLVCCADENDAGMTTSRIMYYPESNTIWYDGGEIQSKPFRAVHTGIGRKIINTDKTCKNVTFMSGCCILIKKDVFTKIGMLPEDYFMYCEDLDYCFKATLKGITMLQNPQSKIYHKVSLAAGGEDSLFSIENMTKNHIHMVKKYIKSGDISSSEIYYLYLYHIYKASRYLLQGKMKLFLLKIKSIF